MKTSNHNIQKERLASLDALRGFNMFWIIGGEKIADALSQFNIPIIRVLAAQLNHAAWNGFTFYDLIYPMFIFVTGVSIVYSLEHRKMRGETYLQISLRILRRTLLLFLCGLYLSNAGLDMHGWLTDVRLLGVLQRIALCYGATAILALFVKPRFQVAIAVFILLGYWLLLRFATVPGFGAGVWYPSEANFANYFDKLFLPGRMYYGTWDVEGILSTFPAIVTCQMGVFTGYWLRKDWHIKGSTLSKGKKALILACSGLLILGLGILWGLDFPINKKIWTSSFTLVTGGLSAFFMALFYWLIDDKGNKKWAFPFIVIGLNPIFIYLAMNAIPWDKISKWLSGWSLPKMVGGWNELLFSLSTLMVGWIVLYWMYKRRIFIKL
jgi:predicted acyltransferase